MTRAGSYAEARLRKQAERDTLITAALPHVPFDGWSVKVLDDAARLASLAGGAARIFPEGPKQAVAHFMDMADRAMLDDLKAHDLAAMKVRARVTLAVRLRLQRWTPHREAVRRALALAPLPSFLGGTLRGWYHTVDLIWRAAGDSAVDFNFYTKRGLLAAVYAATVVHWLDDRSEDCAATWEFLDRRVADAMQIPQIKARVTERLKHLPTPSRLFKAAQDFATRRR